MAEYKFADQLMTPHLLKGGYELERSSLTSEIDPSDVGDCVRLGFETGDSRAHIAGADIIASMVHKALWWPENESEAKKVGSSYPPSLRDLTTVQAADCYGFTIVSSELVERADIKHWVAFANGHATLVLPSEKRSHIHICDPLSPNINQDLTPAIMGEKTKYITDVSRLGRAAVLLYTPKIARDIKKKGEDPFARYPWLYRGDYLAAAQSHRDQGEKGHKIVMSLFKPYFGRPALENYKNMQEALLAGNLTAATDNMQRIGEFYPDMDSRQHHFEMKSLMRYLGTEGHVKYARELLDKYFKTFTFIEDSRFPEAQGDCLKILGQAANDIGVYEAAREYYLRAKDMPRAYVTAIEGKLHKLGRLTFRLN
jgi:hypothetical protein